MIAHPALCLVGKQAPYEIWLNAPVGAIRPDDAMELARALVQAATLAEWGGSGLGIDGPPQAAARAVPEYCGHCGKRRRDASYLCCDCGHTSWVDLDGIIYQIFRSLKELWKREERRGDPDPIKVYR